MGPPIFAIDALKHTYAGKTVLEIEHLEIQPASIVGLIGPNGSGKSTLLKMLGLIDHGGLDGTEQNQCAHAGIQADISKGKRYRIQK